MLKIQALNPFTTTMNDIFLKAAMIQFNRDDAFSCHCIEDAANQGKLIKLYGNRCRERTFYQELFDVQNDTFNVKLAKLQKKSTSKISAKRLHEIRVLALLFTHHIYNDPESF